MTASGAHNLGGWYLFGGACATRTAPTDSSTLIGPSTTYNGQVYVMERCLDAAFDCHTMEAVSAVRAADNDMSSDFKFDVAGTAGGKWGMGVVSLEPVNGSAVGLDDFAVTRFKDRVRVGWRTGFEIDNLGFHVYRQDGGARVRVTPEPITGSALLAGTGLLLNAGRIYTIDDRVDPDQATPRYWLEQIDMNGQRSTMGPARAAASQPGVRMFDPMSADRGLSANLLALPSTGQGPPAPPAGVPPALEVGQEAPDHWAVAARPAVKLGVDHQGWYEIGQAALVAAGVEPGVDPRKLGLFVEGREVAIQITGEEDGVLDPSDSVGFYGRGQDAPATNTRVYWLAALDRPGLRVAPVKQPPTSPAAASWFWAPIEVRPRSIYFAALRNGPDSNFFGPIIRSTPISQTLRPEHAMVGGAERPLLEVGVQGVSETPHKVAVLVDGVALGTIELDGRERRSVQWPLAGPLQTQDELEVSLQSDGGEADVSVLDFIRLRYPRALVADHGVLALTAPAGASVTVTGLDAADPVDLFDVTDEMRPALLTSEGTAMAGAFSFVVPGSGTRTLLARSRHRSEVPQVRPNLPSRWSAPQDGGDLLVIGRADLLASLGPWQRTRQAQGWTVALVDLEDVYDEFSFGAKNADAIRSFIARARAAWAKRPRAVILLGDASFDARNYFGQGDFDIVPSKLLDTALFETVSDDWFTDFDRDDIADIPVGRWPVRTPADVAILVNKLLSAPVLESPDSAAARPLVFVADRNDELYDFAAASQAVRDAAAPALRSVVVDRNRAAEGADLKAALRQEPLLVSYVGHGSQDLWSGGLLSSDSLPAATEGAAASFWSETTCLNGFFHDASRPSLAESLLLQPTGGAFGVWASSGMTGLDHQTKMAGAFLENLTTRGMPVGEAARLAKAQANSADVRKTWILFGDPTWQMFRKPAASLPWSPMDAGAPAGAGDGGPAASDAGLPASAGPQPMPGQARGCSYQHGGSPGNPLVALGAIAAALALLVRRRRRP